MFFLKMLKQIVEIFQKDISPDQIAWGAALGCILGLVPNMLLKIILFVAIMIFKVNVSAALISCSLYAILSFVLDPLFDVIGFYVLNISVLNSFYTWLYNLPIVPFTNFNNSVVMGSFLFGLIMFVPNGIFAKKFLVYYRTNLRDKVSKWKVIKILSTAINALKISSFVK